MTIETVVADAVEELAGVRHRRDEAAELVAKQAGLYAFYGDERAWSQLQLTPVYDGQPLYVGKAEKSLNGRDVGTHFATGKTVHRLSGAAWPLYWQASSTFFRYPATRPSPTAARTSRLSWRVISGSATGWSDGCFSRRGSSPTGCFSMMLRPPWWAGSDPP